MLDWKTHKFSSGLTFTEAEALVDKLVANYESRGRNPDQVISMLKTHLVRAVRNHKIERDIISSCAAN